MLRREERHLRWAVGRGNRHLRWAVGSLGQGQEGRPCDIFEGAGLEKWEGGLAYGSENRPLQIQILKADVLSLTGHPCVPVADVSGAHPLSPPPPLIKPGKGRWQGGSLRPVWCLLAIGGTPSWGKWGSGLEQPYNGRVWSSAL